MIDLDNNFIEIKEFLNCEGIKKHELILSQHGMDCQRVILNYDGLRSLEKFFQILREIRK